MISSAAPVLSHQGAGARARELLPVFEARAAEAEAARLVPRSSMADLRNSGLFGIATPRRWGGSELPPETWLEGIGEIAAVCGPTGWVYGGTLGHMGLGSPVPHAAPA